MNSYSLKAVWHDNEDRIGRMQMVEKLTSGTKMKMERAEKE